MDLENLDLEEVDKEMVADDASQSTAPVGDAPENAPLPPPDDDPAIDAWTCYLFFFFFFLCAWFILGLFNSNSRTIFLF